MYTKRKDIPKPYFMYLLDLSVIFNVSTKDLEENETVHEQWVSVKYIYKAEFDTLCRIFEKHGYVEYCNGDIFSSKIKSYEPIAIEKLNNSIKLTYNEFKIANRLYSRRGENEEHYSDIDLWNDCAVNGF